MNKINENYQEELDINRKYYEQDKETIVADESRSQEWKNEKLNELYTKHHKKHKELLAERKQAIANYGKQQKERLFGIKNPSVADQLAFDNTVAQLSSSDVTKRELSNRLESGSGVTQKAVAKAAFERGANSVFDEYVKQNPDTLETAQELVNWQESTGSTRSKMKEQLLNNFPK